MSEYEEVLNILDELAFKLYREHWTDIKVLEEEDARYSKAVKEAIEAIKRLEDLMR
jgi:hypothetical protein